MRKIKKIAALIILFNSCFGINGAAIRQGPYGQESPAQDPGIETTVRGLLKSPRSQDRAWGAYLIGSDHLKNLSPLLIDLLENGNPDKNIEERLVIHCALDSLIQMRQSIPAKMVSSLFSRFPNETLILAAGNPKETQGALLGLIMEDRSDLQWFAISNILSKEKTPGFAALLTQGFEIKISINVVDDIFTGIGSGSGGGIGCSTSCGGGLGLLEGFPPIGMYKIDDRPDQSDGVVSGGRHPIFFQRRMVAAGDFFGNNSGCINQSSRNKHKLGYLADMLGVEESAVGISLDSFQTLHWHNSLLYPRQVAQIQKQIETTFANFVTRLADNGLVSGADADTLHPNISVEIFDARGDQSVRLPKPGRVAK